MLTSRNTNYSKPCMNAGECSPYSFLVFLALGFSLCCSPSLSTHTHAILCRRLERGFLCWSLEFPLCVTFSCLLFYPESSSCVDVPEFWTVFSSLIQQRSKLCWILLYLWCGLRTLYGLAMAVQWLRLHSASAGALVQSLVRELSSYMPRSMDKKNHLSQGSRLGCSWGSPCLLPFS